MRITLERFHRVSSRGTIVRLTLVAIMGTAAPALSQHLQSFEVIPLIGARLGGTFNGQPDSPETVEATLDDTPSYGVATGIRFDDFSLIEFRWTQSTSALQVGAPFVLLDASVGDFTWTPLSPR